MGSIFSGLDAKQTGAATSLESERANLYKEKCLSKSGWRSQRLATSNPNVANSFSLDRIWGGGTIDAPVGVGRAGFGVAAICREEAE
jgi:hypothetical protein